MTFEPATNEAMEAALAKHFPEEVHEELTSFTHPETCRQKSLGYSLSGVFAGDEYQFDGVTYTVGWDETTRDFTDRAAAIEFYNSLDLSEELEEV
jgi:hypothetical protein